METSTQTTLVLAAQAGDQLAFETLVEPYQRELFVHRYRMLGSFHNAEDLVQETRLARMGETCDPHESGIVPSLVVPHRHQSVPQYAQEGSQTLLAIRDASPERSEQLFSATTTRTDPQDRAESREQTTLAFLIALQHLTPAQRAILLLREVLEWPAAEVANGSTSRFPPSIPPYSVPDALCRSAGARRDPDHAPNQPIAISA